MNESDLGFTKPHFHPRPRTRHGGADRDELSQLLSQQLGGTSRTATHSSDGSVAKALTAASQKDVDASDGPIPKPQVAGSIPAGVAKKVQVDGRIAVAGR